MELEHVKEQLDLVVLQDAHSSSNNTEQQQQTEAQVAQKGKFVLQ